MWLILFQPPPSNFFFLSAKMARWVLTIVGRGNKIIYFILVYFIFFFLKKSRQANEEVGSISRILSLSPIVHRGGRSHARIRYLERYS